MKYEKELGEIFNQAYQNAKQMKHEYITPEHILDAMLEYPTGKEIIIQCGGDPAAIRKDLSDFFKDQVPAIEDKEPMATYGFEKLIATATMHVQASQKELVKVGDILAAIFDEEESHARYFLEKQGIRKLHILQTISHGQDNQGNDFNQNGSKSGDQPEKSEEEKKKQFLAQFTVELTERAKKNELDPLIGRADIMKRTLQVICRRTKNNPVHVGDPGVGKTALIEGLAQMIVKNEVPEKLRDFKIYHLDMGSLLAGTRFRGDFEERLKKVLNLVQEQERSIIYIDEIHTIVGAGSVSGGSMDASNILKPYLTTGKMHFIGSTTYDEYKKYFEKDRALSRRFQKIEVGEPSIEESVKILEGLKSRYEDHHHVKYTKKAIQSACELSAKYIHERFLPDKAIDVIDEAGSEARLEAGSSSKRISISEKEIEKIVSFIAKIPKETVNDNEIEKLKTLEDGLKSVIYGQAQAIEMTVRAIKRSRAGLNDANKPIASLLFVGQTGVGKTELAKQTAQLMGMPLIRFDMSEYQEEYTVSRLVGSSPGYVGYEEGGQLTEAIRKSPYAVLLLDEIEKAHPNVYNILLQIMDYATLTENNGRKVDFRNVIMIMTSNAGAREVGKAMLGFGERRYAPSEIKQAVERTFAPEFRNRLDSVIVFNPLDMEMAQSVVRKAVREFENKLTGKNIKLQITDKCVSWIAKTGLDSQFGAREIIRIVQDKIKTYFVDEVLFGSLTKGGKVQIDLDDQNEIVIRKI